MRGMRKGDEASAGTLPTLAGIVLAAGAGERMGGPKALLLVQGEPLARLHARRLREAGCAKVVIVTRGEIVERFALDATVAASAAPDPAGSLAVGLKALGAAPDDVLVITPVDAFPVCVETIARLVETVGGGAEAATPRSGGKGGHPVVIRARALGPSTTLRTHSAKYSPHSATRASAWRSMTLRSRPISTPPRTSLRSRAPRRGSAESRRAAW